MYLLFLPQVAVSLLYWMRMLKLLRMRHLGSYQTHFKSLLQEWGVKVDYLCSRS
jgi:hypothetical protein